MDPNKLLSGNSHPPGGARSDISSPSNYGATSPKTKLYGNHGNPVTMITYM
jgi:hypothetical protein